MICWDLWLIITTYIVCFFGVFGGLQPVIVWYTWYCFVSSARSFDGGWPPRNGISPKLPRAQRVIQHAAANVGKAIINHQYVDGLYPPSMVKLGIVDYCFNPIIE